MGESVVRWKYILFLINKKSKIKYFFVSNEKISISENKNKYFREQKLKGGGGEAELAEFAIVYQQIFGRDPQLWIFLKTFLQ